MADHDESDRIAAGPVVHVADLLDSAAVRLPEDAAEYPLALQLALFELFSSLRDAEPLRRDRKDRAAGIDCLRAVAQFLARFERGSHEDLTASFLSMESALMALDRGMIEPLLRHTPLVGRGANSRDRDLVISAAVVAVHQ